MTIFSSTDSEDEIKNFVKLAPKSFDLIKIENLGFVSVFWIASALVRASGNGADGVEPFA